MFIHKGRRDIAVSFVRKAARTHSSKHAFAASSTRELTANGSTDASPAQQHGIGSPLAPTPFDTKAVEKELSAHGPPAAVPTLAWVSANVKKKVPVKAVVRDRIG